MHYINLIAVIIGTLVFRYAAGKRMVNNAGYLMIAFPVTINTFDHVNAYLLAGMCFVGVMLAGYRR
jgi:hypothetical protein